MRCPLLVEQGWLISTGVPEEARIYVPAVQRGHGRQVMFVAGAATARDRRDAWGSGLASVQADRAKRSLSVDKAHHGAACTAESLGVEAGRIYFPFRLFLPL